MNEHVAVDHSRTAIFGTREDPFKKNLQDVDQRENSQKNQNPTFGRQEGSKEELSHHQSVEHINSDLREREQDRGISCVDLI